MLVLKRNLFLLIAVCVVFALIMLTCSFAFATATEYDVDRIDPTSWYSSTRKPIFYGAVEITLNANSTESFDVKDSRFRIFARDFEDGDLTKDIVYVKNDVDITVSGEYSVVYSVTDSHGNTADITVPVHVNDLNDGIVKVKRSVYTVPRLSHLKNVGVERCDNGDRQSLGIYLPSGAQAKITLIDADKDMTITYFTNTRAQNGFTTLKKDVADGQTVTNVKNGESFDCVPLITSPRLDQDGYPDKSYVIEVEFDSSVKPLDHYRYGDDQADFLAKWRQSQNSFGLIDGEAILFVVPFADIDKTDGSFGSIDNVLDYYLAVVNKMDDMIGLSLDPDVPTDQNFRTKYTAVSDSAMKGIGAYYESSFIAVCSESVAGFFNYGWAALHEIAHGYQGRLGRGHAKGESLYLNETGNNILAHYVQTDKDIYKANHDWLGGSLDVIEQRYNQKRVDGEQIFTNAQGTYTNVQEKLYCLINLFDAFESETTYAKMFSEYRRMISEYGEDKYSVADFYAIFFAKEYGANVIPYLTDWTMNVSQSVQRDIYSDDYEPFMITSSILSESTLESVKDKENITLDYGLISDSIVRKLGQKATLSVNVAIDDFDLLKDKTAVLGIGNMYKNDCYRIKIEQSNFSFDDLTAGVYYLHMPTLSGYDSDVFPVTLKEGDNDLVCRYEKHSESVTAQTKFAILGIYGTVGFSMILAEDNLSAEIALGGADLGNRNSYWQNRPDEVYASVEIVDNDNLSIASWIVKGNAYFSDLTLENKVIELKYGYKVKVYTYRPQGLAVYYKLNGAETRMTEYDVQDNSVEYEITANGLKAKDMDESAILFDYAKKEYIKIIRDYQSYVEKRISDEGINELNDKTVNSHTKNRVLSAYENLPDEERKEFDDFVVAIRKGGSPIIKISTDLIVVKAGDKNFDLFDYIRITDNEDYFISSTGVSFEPNVNVDVVGRQRITVTALDSDGNTSSESVWLSVVGSFDSDEKTPEVKSKLGVGAIIYISVLSSIGAIAIAVGITFIIIKRKRV